MNPVSSLPLAAGVFSRNSLAINLHVSVNHIALYLKLPGAEINLPWPSEVSPKATMPIVFNVCPGYSADLNGRTNEGRKDGMANSPQSTHSRPKLGTACHAARPPVFLGAAATAVVLLVFSRGRRVRAGQRVE